MLGLLDKTQSESRKIERKMSDKCLESKRGTTVATMETQRGAKAPLVSSLSQDSLPPPPPSKSPVLLPTGQCGSPWLSKRHKHANESAAQKKPVFPLRLSADHFGLSSPQILCPSSLGSVLLFMFRPPVITSLTISPPLRHPVSVCLEK